MMGDLLSSNAGERVPEAASSHLSHLDLLEAEAIAILRETAAEFSNPVLMYSIGKDSQVLLHLARKAFYPAKLPFPLLHIDTGWKFREMYQFRDNVADSLGLRLLVHKNQRAAAEGMNPFDYSSQVYTHATKTLALLEALRDNAFDAALGGARRDEERSRAKERVFSFRDAQGQWDPRRQRPELWDVYNGRVRSGESMRVFPMSNWTELDVWLYILRENIPVVPLYFAEHRPVVARAGTWIMADDERMRLHPGEQPQSKLVRFRTLGCYPLSGAIESDAASVADIINEMLTSRRSERAGRLIDFDEDGSMESKKREGYF
jgi:sulfate adenylyltransferase subunit 2